jgi:hypothetical protein
MAASPQPDSKTTAAKGREREQVAPTAGPTESPEPLRRNATLACLLLLIVACLVPFAARPYFIDDPLFLRVAQQIQKHPADFFGFQMNWSTTERPMYQNLWNPPLTSYYIAFVGAIAGWSEVTMHLAFLLPALAAVWGIFSLAGLLGCDRALATAAAVFTPAFLVSSLAIMSDVMMLALWVWTLVAFERGLQKNAPKLLMFSGILAGLALLTKFTSLALTPLLVAYGFARQRRAGLWLVAPLLPLLVAAGYEWYTHHLYGVGHIQLSLALNHAQQVHRGLLDELTTGLVFAGGSYVTCCFYAGRFLSKRVVIAAPLVFLLCCWLWPHFFRFADFLRPRGNLNWGLTLQAGLFGTCGLSLLALALADMWERRDAVSVLLLCWVLGIFVYASVMYYMVNVRGLLPMCPAVGMLIARRIQGRRKQTPSEQPGFGFEPAALTAVVPAMLLSVALVHADCNVANAERTVATNLCAKHQQEGRTIWFEGHWGFQYYMEQCGARALDQEHPSLGPSDLLAMPNSAPGVVPPDLNNFVLVDAMKQLPNRWLSTLNTSLGAGFYSDYRGPLPFAFGRIKPDYYLVFRPK